MPKDVVVPDVADWYQKRGFTALIFDTYSIGESDGEPRCDVRFFSVVASSLSSEFADFPNWETDGHAQKS
jgi:hypothetical protein